MGSDYSCSKCGHHAADSLRSDKATRRRSTSPLRESVIEDRASSESDYFDIDFRGSDSSMIAEHSGSIAASEASGYDSITLEARVVKLEAEIKLLREMMEKKRK